MTKLEYFIYAMQNKLYMNRKWLTRVCAVLLEKLEVDEFPSLVDGKIQFLKDGNPVILSDAVPDQPVYGINESVRIPLGTLPNMAEDTDTTYRHCIMNAIMLVYPFGDKVPYRTERFKSVKEIDKLAETMLRNKEITTAEYKKLFDCFLFIDFLSDFSVPTASRQTLEPSAEAKRVRDEMVEKYKDQLTDPVVVAAIDEEITKVLMREAMDDPASGFFVNPKKSIAKVRKMTHGMIGAVPDLKDPTKVKTITRSLDEGWTADDIPALVNRLRGGSYDRGKDTAFGGEAAKNAGRMNQNTKVVEPDCGSKVGIPFDITEENHSSFVSLYRADKPGKAMTEEDLKSNIGKILYIRLPATCNTPNGNYCKKCMGDSIGNADIGLGPLISAVTSVFLSISLSKFHGKVLSTERWDPKTQLT